MNDIGHSGAACFSNLAMPSAVIARIKLDTKQEKSELFSVVSKHYIPVYKSRKEM